MVVIHRLRTDAWIIDSWMGETSSPTPTSGPTTDVGLDIHEPGRKSWLLAMEAGKRMALDQLIHLAIPMAHESDWLYQYLRKIKLFSTTMV